MSILFRKSNNFIFPRIVRVVNLPKNDIEHLYVNRTCFNLLNRFSVLQVSNYVHLGNNQRHFSSCNHMHQKIKEKEKTSAIIESKESAYAGLTLGGKVKQVGKDATYIGIVVVGIGVLGVIAYAVGRELFSSSSPSGIYGHAFKKCKQNSQIVDILGEPIKGYGETSRRGRRRHVSHVEFLDDQNVKHMRMKFYIEGPHKKGTVTLEAKENERRKYEMQFIYVELDGYPSRVIVVEDNR